MNLKGKSFLKLLDLTSEEISGLLDLAAELLCICVRLASVEKYLAK